MMMMTYFQTCKRMSDNNDQDVKPPKEEKEEQINIKVTSGENEI